MLKKFIWPLISVISIILIIVFISGFVISISISNENPEDDIEKNEEEVDEAIIDQEGSTGKEQEEVLDSSEINNVLVIGDSMGYGVGAEDNIGIGDRYVELISERQNRDLELANLSVPGARSADLVNFINSDENIDFISNADMIIISIGGNDINRIVIEDLSTDTEYEELLNNYKIDLNTVIEKIREVNKDSQIVIVGLYNPYERENPEQTRYLLNWNYETRLIVNSTMKMIYIPTYEKFEYNLDLYLADDKFHPSNKGYQIIAEELYNIVNRRDDYEE